MSLLKGEGTGVPEGNVAGVVRLGLPPSWHWLHASQSGLRASSGPSHMPTGQTSSHAVAEGVGAGVPEGVGRAVVRLGLPPSWHWLHASQAGLRASSGPPHMPMAACGREVYNGFR